MVNKIFTLLFGCKEKSIIFVLQYREVEQWLARWAHNPKVAGSSPALATKLKGLQNSNPFLYFLKEIDSCYVY